MANPQQIKILRQGAKVWNKWRADNPGVIAPDLNRANLSGVYLIRANRFIIYEINGFTTKQTILDRVLTIEGVEFENFDFQDFFEEERTNLFERCKLVLAEFIGWCNYLSALRMPDELTDEDLLHHWNINS